MNIDFFCFQPILFDEKAFLKVQSSNFIPKNWDKINIDYINTNCDCIINYIKYIERHEIYLLNDFSLQIKYNFKNINNLDFININKNNSSYAVFYDKDYKVFFLIFKLSFTFNENFENSKLIGLYKKIRDELVYDNANMNDSISEWAEQIRESSLKKINELFEDNVCKIIPNSGYIFSSYPNFEHENSIKIKDFKDNFLNNNHLIDLVNEKKELFESFSFLKSKTENIFEYHNSPYIFFLGWRFTTMYGLKNNDDLNLIPIFLNLQNIYFQIDNFYKPYLSKLYEEIRYDNDYNNLNEKIGIFDKLEVAFQNLIFEKDKFVSELKPFQFEIFNYMEDYWGMNKDYSNIEKTLKICQSSLDRKINIERNQIQEKQSNILFILAIIQIFSIVSISTDFFSLIKLDSEEEYQPYQIFLKNNLLFILISVSTTLIIIAYYKQIFYKIKRFF